MLTTYTIADCWESNPSYTSRESNPGRMNGNHPCCHYTTSVCMCLFNHKGRLENRRFELLTSRMQSEHSTTELIPQMSLLTRRVRITRIERVTYRSSVWRSPN